VIAMMERTCSLRKCRVALESIAVRYFLMRGRSSPPRRRWSRASAAEAIYFDCTLDVMDAITIDAILN
jgi:hypothetical protein